MASSLILITAPTVPVVSLAEAKTHLEVALDTSDKDAQIAALVAASAGQIDAAYGGWLERALRPQTWELRRSSFDDDDYDDDGNVELPYPPLITVDSVKYDDADGVEQTLVLNTGYRILDLGGRWKQSIAPIYDGSWPTARSDGSSVRIRFTSGYPLTPVDLMPPLIKSWVLLNVGYLFKEREAEQPLPRETLDALIHHYRLNF